MKNKFKNNSGFSLIELIIAMAILAIMMTAICSIMGSSVAGHRKSKAEIRVHTAAQETYNQVTDTIMQAKDVIIVGYVASKDYDFTTPGASDGTSPTLVYYVKDKAMKDFIIANPGVYGTGSPTDPDSATEDNIHYFSGHKCSLSKKSADGKVTYDCLGSDVKIYVKKLIFVTSAEINESDIGDSAYSSSSMANTIEDGVFGGNITLKKDTLPSGVTKFNMYDTVVHTYTFEENNMYYEKKHSIMTKRDHEIEISGSDPNLEIITKEQNLYNEGLSYIKAGTAGVSVSGCIATVDADRGAIGVEFRFNDKNMTYTTKGMVNIRNSYILKAREK